MAKTQGFDNLILSEALKKTVEHRKTTHILNDTLETIKTIETSEILKDRWTRYSNNYPYAENITYEETIKALRMLIIWAVINFKVDYCGIVTVENNAAKFLGEEKLLYTYIIVIAIIDNLLGLHLKLCS
ncbi:MAG: hypothetical protein RBT15_08710 [Gudongella sp.]|nr:hypothetical protein [Gudongella sp.]